METHAAVGLRDRKKQETRDRLAHVATLLFIERGFENVTIAEIAAAADVSKMTVTNYFPRKEDLVFDAHENVVDSLAKTLRDRRPGESALRALHREFVGSLDANRPLNGLCTTGFAQLVHDSERLRARERELDEKREAALADALAAEAGATDPAPVLVAAQLAAAHRVLVHRGRALIRERTGRQAVRAELTELAESAFTLLEPALGGCYER
ncbi:DNA-binding transcriptional regulator, AcrR family [Amycolatopsis xylanica]|uniref:DNA-binding transcriptional regulator, AcrR family n=1 Tax=Amycolatopsis xylanica TaxID=589385 RepID=A0A1H3PQ99_9PSEU|nr:TetR/AcrR family transcriptional regulator [Amycolatopsis xylanica]SDZ03163.1 DNA-binding transcriptional regulator, AcrR family [Amycolatopsis xylanica]